MRRDYRFDYRKARPNRFASQFQAGAVAVVLDPDVASVFRSPASVNALLRSVISALRAQGRMQRRGLTGRPSRPPRKRAAALRGCYARCGSASIGTAGA